MLGDEELEDEFVYPVNRHIRPLFKTECNTVQLYNGNCLDVLSKMSGESVHTIVTSPPYWGLRDYGTNSSHELGNERTSEEYVTRITKIFREAKRVLRHDGTLWLNIGDSYDNGNLAGVPWRVALALQKDGWILRQDIIWIKRDPVPESVENRCTKAHEYIFLLSKNTDYYYDHYAVKEESVYPAGFMPSGSMVNATKRTNSRDSKTSSENHGGSVETLRVDGTRNKRSWWDVTSGGYLCPHFAVYPPKLIEPCILASTSAYGCCAKCGCQYKRITQKEGSVVKNADNLKRDRTVGNRNGLGQSTLDGKIGNAVTTGWEKDCYCSTDKVSPCIVLDPFMGSGTTAEVSIKHNRRVWGIELNAEYIKLQIERIERCKNRNSSVIDFLNNQLLKCRS